MRRAIGLACAVSLLAALPAGSAQAAPKKHRCTAKGATTLTKNRHARVFETPGREADETGRLYGCVYKLGRRVLLDTSSDDEYVTSETYGSVTLNRTRVAWEHTSTDVSCKADCPPGYDGQSTGIRVADLRKRKVRTRAGDPFPNQLVVTPTGAVAWIDEAGPHAVRAVDADGARTLFAGDGVDTSSLRLSGSTVSWVAAGAPMSATLR